MNLATTGKNVTAGDTISLRNSVRVWWAQNAVVFIFRCGKRRNDISGIGSTEVNIASVQRTRAKIDMDL